MPKRLQSPRCIAMLVACQAEEKVGGENIYIFGMNSVFCLLSVKSHKRGKSSQKELKNYHCGFSFHRLMVACLKSCFVI